ncbi:succinate-semialdehyde dehydrogenase, mitochondrial [Iris pallida]|uniref:Succinate-semialdehyde dehydrogenase, mitochondrial n=1 Tax=Iris pallida TaxID=29817 RepID=A0AAX6F840_IRIPA|nr:succinate-semialdehyde dehydrogenase, mitochondrial [Iris pallida]
MAPLLGTAPVLSLFRGFQRSPAPSSADPVAVQTLPARFSSLSGDSRVHDGSTRVRGHPSDSVIKPSELEVTTDVSPRYRLVLPVNLIQGKSGCLHIYKKHISLLACI